jgi:hypothetical protein
MEAPAKVNLETVIREMALTSDPDILESNWERSQAALPDGDLFFLAKGFVVHACEETGIPQQVTEAAVAAAERISARPAARALAWHFHYDLYRAADHPRHHIDQWPSLDHLPAGDGRMLCLLVLLSGLPGIEELNRAHGVPTQIARDTLSDVTRWLGGDEDGPLQPPWGITPQAISWLILHFKGELYRLGRLQFQFAPCNREIRAFRNRTTGVAIALSGDGIRYRRDGGRAAQCVATGPGAWTSRLVVTELHTIGNPISPDGRALPEEITLEAADWPRVLAPDQPVLYVHIPTGGPMAHDQCGQSFRSALEFFRCHFPERPFHAFCCSSWLLDAELQQFLPETSNIVRFQREFYLFPVPIAPWYVLRNILGDLPDDLSSAPRRTALQRAVVDHVSGGNSLRPTGGAGFVLPEDLDWGSQVYLKQELPWAKA